MSLTMKLSGFFQGNARTVKARKNVIASMVLKGIDGVVYLLLVPVTLGYINPYEYGIWLTLNSILLWIDSFDIGLGNGMRNRVAEALAKGRKEEARIYVSTTFFMLCLLMAGLVALGSVLAPFIDWYSILHTNHQEVARLGGIVYITFLIYCLNFVFKFIGNVYLALQLPAVNNFFVTMGHLLSLGVIWALTFLTPGSLLLVAVVYSAGPLTVYLIAYPVTFFRILPFLRPSISGFRKEYLKDLFGVGVIFFILQLSGILLFSLANVLISRLFGPETVTPYNIAYRYYSLVPMVMTLLTAPMWSASTDAWSRGESDWIRVTMRRIHYYLMLAVGVLVVMTAVSEEVYSIWVGKEVSIGMAVSCWMGLYTIILVVSQSYAYFLNGMGKLKLQALNTLIVGLLFYPVCHYLGLSFGLTGVLFGMCLLNCSGLILNIIQFHKVTTGKATGIWAK